VNDEFPSNAHGKRREERPRPEKGEQKQIQQIAKGRVTIRKKPLRRKLLEAFRPEDGVGFLEYTLLEVLVPGLKNSVADASTEMIENALGVGGSRSRSRRRSQRDGGYTSYNRMGGARRDRDRDDRRDDRRSRRDRSVDQREFITDSRVEANEILDTMFEIISKYEVATVRDLLGLLGEPHNFTDEDWGWTDLRGARIHKVREGYLIDVPRPEPLD
jgi:hypothetical protein